MEKTFVYTPKGVCSRQIEIHYDGDAVTAIHFQGGCPGNTQGVASLAKGRKIDELIACLEGTRCGPKPTSCTDQLAKALRQIKEQND